MSLNPKKEKFAQLVVEGHSQSEAYRQSHPNSLKWKDETVWNKASALMRDGEVSARVAALREKAAERHEITVDDLIKELEEARVAALTCETPQSSAAVAATMGKGKLLGLDKQILEHTGPNGGPLQTVTRIELVAGSGNSEG